MTPSEVYARVALLKAGEARHAAQAVKLALSHVSVALAEFDRTYQELNAVLADLTAAMRETRD